MQANTSLLLIFYLQPFPLSKQRRKFYPKSITPKVTGMKWHFSAEMSGWYEAEGKAMVPGACLLGRGTAQPFISLVTLGKLLNLSGPYSTFTVKYPLTKGRHSHRSLWQNYMKEETLWNNLKGWNGVGGGSKVQEEGHRYAYGWVIWMFGRNQYNFVRVSILQLKINKCNYFLKRGNRLEDPGTFMGEDNPCCSFQQNWWQHASLFPSLPLKSRDATWGCLLPPQEIIPGRDGLSRRKQSFQDEDKEGDKEEGGWCQNPRPS